MWFFKPDVNKLFSQRNFKGLMKALGYRRDESIQQKAKSYLIALGREVGR
jgi:hypothetical protein